MALAHSGHEHVGEAGRGDLSVAPVKAPQGRAVPELATAKSRTWVTESGAYSTRVYGRAINVRDQRGKWTAIDNTLRAEDGAFSNGPGNYDLSLPATLDRSVELVDGDAKLSLKLRGASSAEAVVSGSSATYAGAGNGVDARWTAFNEAVKEDLLLRGADSQTSFTYDLGLSDGLTTRERKDGGVDVVHRDGEIAFAIPAAVAVDAGGAVAPAGAASISVSGSQLTIALDAAWVKADGRAFPVTLDPSVGTGSARDCFVDELDSTTNFCSSGELWVGRAAAGHNHNALLNFNLAGVVPTAAFVQSAEVGVYPLYQTNAGTAKTLHLRKVTTDWDDNATWIKRTASANWATPGGDLAATSESSLPVPGSGQWSWYPVTNLVTSWLDGTETNRGVAITDAGSTVDNTVVYASHDWADSNAWPYLDVEYFPRAGQPGNYTIDSDSITDRSDIGVNVAGGNLMVSSSDLNVAAKGLPVSVDRTFNSRDVWDGQMGYRGRLSMGEDIALYDCDQLGSKCLVGPTGFRVRFSKKPDGSFETPPNVGNLKLSRATPTSGRYTLTDNNSGTKWGFFDHTFSFSDEITDRHGNKVSFQFNGPQGSLSKITDANGRQYPVTSNSSGFITKIEVPSAQFAGGVAWNYAYNANGDLTSVTDPENKTTTYTYVGGALTKITDPRLNETLITYDALDRVTSVTRKIDGTVANDIKTTYAYPAVDADCNKNGAADPKVVGKTVVTDPNGNATKYCYAQSGSVVKAINAKGNETDTTYTSNGNADSIMGFAGTGNANAETKFKFASGGGYNLTQIDGAAGEQTKVDYPNMSGGALADPLDEYRPTKVTDTNGKISKFQYSNGNPTSISSENASGVTQRSVQMTWNADGTMATSKVNNDPGRVTTYGYDSMGRLTSVAPPTPTITPATTFTYDGLSRVKTVKDGRGKITTFNYDKLDRTTSIVDNGAVTQTFGYDANGNQVNRSESGKTSTFTYDKLNRRIGDSLPGSVTNSYTWDKNSNLKTLTDSTGTVTYGYDPLNRTSSMNPGIAGENPTVWQYTDPTGGTNAASAFVTQTLPGNGKIKSTADLSGKLTETIVTNSANAQTLKRTYNYSTYQSTSGGAHELLDWAEEQDGSAAPITTKVYDYDETVQLTRASTYDGAGNLTARDELTIDPYGNRTKRVRTIGSSTTTRSYAYNTANQLCWYADIATANGCGSAPTGATSFSYDADGNQLTGGTAATYDDKGRVATFGGSALTHLSSSNAELTAIGTSTFRNHLLGVGYIDVGGNVSRLQRSPDNGVAVSQTRDGARRWFVVDHLGSTIGLVSSAGNVERKFAYTIDGEDTTTGTGPTTWIRYSGGHDIGNGLYHYGERYYSTATARWTQRDPVDQPDDLVNQNPYIYAGNNPVNFTDPDGDVPFLVAAVGARALWGAAKWAAPKALKAAKPYFRPGKLVGEKRVSFGPAPQHLKSSYGAHAHIGSKSIGGDITTKRNIYSAYYRPGGGSNYGKRPRYK